jgi:uncharacterized membrane protein YgcG
MSIITTIDDIPLFSTTVEALNWALSQNLPNAFHTHYYNGQTGYMGGPIHTYVAESVFIPTPPPVVQPVVVTEVEITPPIIISSSSGNGNGSGSSSGGGNGSSGGGGGGY